MGGDVNELPQRGAREKDAAAAFKDAREEVLEALEDGDIQGGLKSLGIDPAEVRQHVQGLRFSEEAA